MSLTTTTRWNPRRAAFAAVATAALALAGGAIAQNTAPGEGASSKHAEPEQEKFVYVKMMTTEGDILLELNNEKAPISVENFVRYMEEGHYAGTVFHRVIPNFMIQGGGFTGDGVQKEVHAPIKNEWRNGLSNVRGTIAMARTAVADSATSQFYINVKDNAFLDKPRTQREDDSGYAVFGRVVGGMDVVDRIRYVQTATRRGMGDWPVENVVIEEVRAMTPEEIDAMEASEAEAESAG